MAAAWAGHLRERGWFDRAYIYALGEPSESAYPDIALQSSWLQAGDPGWQDRLIHTTRPRFDYAELLNMEIAAFKCGGSCSPRSSVALQAGGEKSLLCCPACSMAEVRRWDAAGRGTSPAVTSTKEASMMKRRLGWSAVLVSVGLAASSCGKSTSSGDGSAGQPGIDGNCPEGQTPCSGVCVNLAADGTNCGSCGNVCPAGMVCSLGLCSDSCAPGLTQCGSGCTDISADVSNCGGCGLPCLPGQGCVNGSCICSAGQTLCAGVCTNTATDPSNCGVCGNVCAGGSCIAGQCSGGGTGGSGTGGSGTGGSGTGGSGTGGAGTGGVGTGGVGTGGVGTGGAGTGGYGTGGYGTGGYGTGGDGTGGNGTGGNGTGGDGTGGDGTGGDGTGGGATGGDAGAAGDGGTGGSAGTPGTGGSTQQCDTSWDTYPDKGDGLALTPPMAWNSWNVFHENINETQIREIADAMVTSGMRDAGYEYLNLDDKWMDDDGRDGQGNLYGDSQRFPSGIPDLVSYVNGLGLKLGLYGDRGTMTCAGVPESGSYGNYQRDAQTFADWGVDYLKFDNCNLPAGRDSAQALQQDYEEMSAALRATGRPIVFSICAWDWKGEWMIPAAHLWRSTFDIGPCFSGCGEWYRNIDQIIDENNETAQYAGPGHWNDPDMLEVGNSGLSDTEAAAHFSMWAIMAAPLVAGNDVRNMSNQIRDILTNTDVIAVDQDPAGIQGTWVVDNGDLEVWMKPLCTRDGPEKAVALLNRSGGSADITVSFNDIGISGTATVRDLWAHQDLGEYNGSFSANVPSHGVVMVKIVETSGT